MKRAIEPTGERRTPWSPPTRRAFMAMLGAAATALAIRARPRMPDPEPPQRPWTGTTRWIGHC